MELIAISDGGFIVNKPTYILSARGWKKKLCNVTFINQGVNSTVTIQAGGAPPVVLIPGEFLEFSVSVLNGYLTTEYKISIAPTNPAAAHTPACKILTQQYDDL